MKKIIAIAVLALGVLVWRMGAMNDDDDVDFNVSGHWQTLLNKEAENQNSFVYLQPKDSKKLVKVSKKDALFFKTIADVIGEVGLQKNAAKVIKVPNVTERELATLLWNLNWLQKKNITPDSSDIAIRGALRTLPKIAYSQEALTRVIACLKAAAYLQASLLVQIHATIIADMLRSDALLQSFYENNSELVGLLSNRTINPDLKAIIYQYMPETWVELHTLAGHTKAVQSAEFSRDGTKVLTASVGRTARIWNANTGALLHTLAGRAESSLESAVFSRDGNKVITASNDGNAAKIWNANTGVLLFTLSGHTNGVRSAEFSRDGNKVITASNDRTAKIWDANTGVLLHTLAGHILWINSAVFSRDGTKVLTASGDNTAKIWDANTGVLLHTLAGHTLWVRSAVFSRDGNKVITASGDNTAKIWDANTGALLYTLAGHTDWLYPVVFSRDGNKVITASNDGTAKIWNANTGALLYALAEHTPRVKSVEFSRDGKKVVTASRDNTARIWDANTGALLRTLAGHTNGVRSAKFSRDGKKVVTASGDNTAKIWLLPQDNVDQALFIQVLQWARRNNKPMMFGAWMHNVFNTYDAATKNNIEKLFGPFRWMQGMQTEEQSVGKKRKAEKELGPSNPKQIILEERYEEEDRGNALEYLRKQELKKQKEAMEGFGGS